MKFLFLFLSFSLLVAVNVEGQATPLCSGQRNRFGAPSTQGQCTNWPTKTNIRYPQDFGGLFNQVKTYQCPTSGLRIIISNNIPDHDVTIWRDTQPCEVFSAVEIPLNPPNPDPNTPSSEKTEVPIRGMVAMALNGVPAFGPQESDSLNAVEAVDSDKIDAGFWYGHPGGNNGWHVHNPQMGRHIVNDTTLLGWSMDGFKIFGPLTDDVVDSELDECNGRLVDGVYQYHVRTLDQVDNSTEYCNGDSPVTNWNYIFGCYSGDISNSRMVSSVDYDLPEDCVLESRGSCTDNPDYFYDGNTAQTCEWVGQDAATRCALDPDIMTECPSTCNNLACAGGGGNDDNDGPKLPLNPTNKPNVIIIQPDDLIFYNDWGRPPHSGTANLLPGRTGFGDDMPFLEDLRAGGLQMSEAYTASPVCGTSRYSTITGKMPSRAASIRKRWDSATDEVPAFVTIPTTKLLDTNTQKDCSEENLAAAFGASDDYETAMIGKWHLSRFNDEEYDYANAVSTIQQCGFSHVGGLYIENLIADENDFNNYSDGTFSHNMEWITYEAIQFINETVSNGKNFFMYFNPTVPHSSNSVEDAINNFSCQNTADALYEWPDGQDPWIKGMSEDDGCEAYRQTIVERANGNTYNLGPIWLDDAIGALVNVLIDNGIYDDTIIVFQEDHGMDAKSSLHEGGIRIPQIVHYPAGIHPGTFGEPVSTVDLAPTLLEYAGIAEPYQNDGTSWKTAVADAATGARKLADDTERCLFFEVDQDRAIRCGCYKYLDIQNENDETLSGTWAAGETNGLANDAGGIIFDLCGGGDSYVTPPGSIQEVNTVENCVLQAEFAQMLECHLANTDPDEDAVFTDCSQTLSLGVVECPSESPSVSSAPSASVAPSGNPSASAAPSESSAPSDIPSSIPSGSPSVIPSEVPSLTPSSIPSGSPSDIPSEVPSGNPSESPSENPSGSFFPSSAPSDSPTVSAAPSTTPSSLPSSIPSDIPSQIPSFTPSSLPSSIPSSIPSQIPSFTPSSLPSAIPSDIPSPTPSANPTVSAGPTSAIRCEQDDPNFYFKKPKKTCEFLGTKFENDPPKLAKACQRKISKNSTEKVSEYCRSTCLVDSTGRFKIDGKRFTCETIDESHCDLDIVSELCPETCNHPCVRDNIFL